MISLPRRLAENERECIVYRYTGFTEDTNLLLDPGIQGHFKSSLALFPDNSPQKYPEDSKMAV